MNSAFTLKDLAPIKNTIYVSLECADRLERMAKVGDEIPNWINALTVIPTIYASSRVAYVFDSLGQMKTVSMEKFMSQPVTPFPEVHDGE